VLEAKTTADRAVFFDVYTMPSGSAVNPFGPGLASGALGVGAVHFSTELSITDPLGFTIPRVLVSGDVSGGLTTVRLYYKKGNTTARLFYATANLPIQVWVKNYGQV
jgi:hypothetical protein